MVGARTKPVHIYGKRNKTTADGGRSKRLVLGLFDDETPAQTAGVVLRMKRKGENNVPTPPVSRPKATSHKPPKPNAAPYRLSRSPSVVKVQKKYSSNAHAKKRIARESTFLEDPTFHPDALPTSTPSRPPLTNFPLNLRGTPRGTPVRAPRLINGKRKGSGGRASPVSMKPTSPIVDVDIIVLGNDGKKICEERRVSRPSVSVKEESLDSQELHSEPDSEDSPPQPKRSRKLKGRARNIVLSSDEEADEEEVRDEEDIETRRPSPASESGFSRRNESNEKTAVIFRKKLDRLPLKVTQSAPSKVFGEVETKEASITPLGKPQILPRPLSSPGQRYRQFAPYHLNSRLPLSPITLSAADDDISAIDLSNLSLEIQLDEIVVPTASHPDYLLPLLEECRQEKSGPAEFSAFIKMFPIDPVVRSRNKGSSHLEFRKIGEASYSEVFGIGDVVLKVVPLRDETVALNAKAKSHSWDYPFESDVKDVVKEIIVTRAMGDVSEHFVTLLKTYVVRGRYPQVLLELWDQFCELKGSESVRPDSFPASQLYAIIVLPNGGPDLEAFSFLNPGKTGWRQACSVFWQVAKTLAHAERLVSFEHRDLHWGQILVKNTAASAVNPLGSQDLNQVTKMKSGRKRMDDPSYGIQVTLIDLGLSRMDAGDGSGGEMVHWTPFDEEVFMGEGDYQFDVYRYMRAHNGDDWESFKPFTNVMWLHYLSQKLLHSKKLKPPSVPRKSTSAGSTGTGFSERDCYECLLDIDSWLSDSLTHLNFPKKSKGKIRPTKTSLFAPTSTIPSCAGEVVEYAKKKGWAKPL